MTAQETRRKLIDTIRTNRANLDYISQTDRINGSLLLDIDRVMEEYAQLRTTELEDENKRLRMGIKNALRLLNIRSSTTPGLTAISVTLKIALERLD